LDFFGEEDEDQLWLMLVHTDGLLQTEGNSPLSILVDDYYHSAFYQSAFQCDLHAEGGMAAILLDPDNHSPMDTMLEDGEELFYWAGMRLATNSTEQVGNSSLLGKYDGLIFPPFALDANGELSEQHASYLQQAIEQDLRLVAVGPALQSVVESALDAQKAIRDKYIAVDDAGDQTGHAIIEMT